MARRIAWGSALVLAVAAGVFVFPTVWGRPWSIEHLYARVFAEFALDHPMLLSQLRLLEPYGLDFHSDDLDDFSTEFQREELAKVRRSLELLRSYDRDAQTEAQRLSTDVLDDFLSLQLEGERFLLHDYPVNQMDGVQSELPEFMLNVHQVHGRRDAENYVRRLEKFGPALDQVIEGLRQRAEIGVLPPRFVFDRVLEEIAGFLAPPPEQHVLLTTFAERLEAVESLGETARAELRAGARRALEERVYPAYARLTRALEALRPQSTGDDGVWKLPHGDAYYAWRLRVHTTTERSADEIHALGLAEVERIHGEMSAILTAEGIPAADPVRALEQLNRDERFLYPEGTPPEEVLADYQAIIDDAQRRLPALFGTLPRAPVVVERVPEFKEDGAPGAYYFPPPFDGSRPGVFYANLRDVRETPKFRMRTLTYHESIPGHHLQIGIAQELSGVPFFRRVLPFTAFIEGWALYAERLAAEQGFHPTPYDRLGQLVDEAFRAVRLVVDTGIHSRRWTRERAIEYMVRNTGMPRSEVVTEIERYIVLPGQACAYKVGQLEILDLRERARAAQGDAFDLAAFHDTLLTSGALPLTLLRGRLLRGRVGESY